MASAYTFRFVHYFLNSHIQADMEIKRLPLDKPEFPANGKIYKVKNTLTVSRFTEFEKLQNHFGYGMSFKELYDRHVKIKELFNKGDSVQAFALFYNTLEGIAYRLEDRTHPALLLCSLFIVTEDEDLTTWNEKEQKTKIDDWNVEGYDVNDFFVLASNLVRGFLPIYGEIFQSISKKEKLEKNPTVKK